ncbi:MAG: heme o synthase [Nitrososphaerales archaeon]
MTVRDYVRLVKPRIIPLLVLVALASAIIAARAVPSPLTLLGLFVGGTLASSGALAVNSYLEIDVDSMMKRTMRRPLPSKTVPKANALVFALSLLALGVLVALLTLNVYATLFIGLGAVVYIPIYTIWLKPRTSWNIVLGGFAGSCAALAGWYAVTLSDPLIAWVLAALVFVWTPSHFWSLAVITESDYSAAGIPMLPSVVGKKRASQFIVANTLLLIPVSLLFFLYLSGTGEVVYLLGAVAFDLGLLATNIKLLLDPTKANAFLAFKFSSPYLAVIFMLGCAAVLL